MVSTKISRSVLVLLVSVVSVIGSDTHARENFEAPNFSGVLTALERLNQQPQAPVVSSLTEPAEPTQEDYPDWLDFPLCVPGTPEPEELPKVVSPEPNNAEIKHTDNLLHSTGTLPANMLASGRLGILGLNNGQLGNLGGGGAGGFPSYSPTTTPFLSPSGSPPVIVGPTGGPVSPEPASIVLLGSGLVGVVAMARRKFK